MGLLTRSRAGLSRVIVFLAVAMGVADPGSSQELPLPRRSQDAPTGSDIVEQIRDLSLVDRETIVVAEILAGNVPTASRRLVPVTRYVGGGAGSTLVVWVTADYMAVGSDDDSLRIPLSPGAAVCIASHVGAVLPTPTLVDAIWQSARIKLGNDSIPPGPEMTTVRVFDRHDDLVDARRLGSALPDGTLVAGHKKDVVVVAQLEERPGHVAIYGWHRPTGRPIQPLYLGHTVDWVDYSHGIRLVSRIADRAGESVDLLPIMSDFDTSLLVSRTGPVDPFVYEAMAGCPAA